MTTLRDFISTRENEVKAQIKALRMELMDLKAAKSALEARGGISITDAPIATTRTIKDMVRDILKSSIFGETSTEILSKINDQAGRHIERTSLSPQLSRMKEDGEVSLVDNRWFLKSETPNSGIDPFSRDVVSDGLKVSPDSPWDSGDDPFADEEDNDPPF